MTDMHNGDYRPAKDTPPPSPPPSEPEHNHPMTDSQILDMVNGEQ